MIVAVDFDGILCENKYPDIGEPNYKMISYVQRMIDDGHDVILWTSRIDDRLEEAVEWCKNYGLHFTTINNNVKRNIDQYGTNSRKVFADIYIDDHNIEFVGEKSSGFAWVVRYMKEVFNYD